MNKINNKNLIDVSLNEYNNRACQFHCLFKQI